MAVQTSERKAFLKLRQRANHEANRRDHILGRWYEFTYNDSMAAYAICRCCGMQANIVVDPPVGVEHIYNDAMFNHCAPQKKPAARPLTIEQVRNWNWKQRANVYALHIRNADGSPRRFRVTREQTWKRDPDRLFFVLSGGPQNRGHQRFEIGYEHQLAGWSLDDPDDFSYPYLIPGYGT